MNIRWCEFAGCTNHAFDSNDLCLEHDPDPRAACLGAIETLTSRDTVADTAYDGLAIRDLDLSGKTFLRCSFHESTFENCVIGDAVIDLCFFDFSRMSGTSFNHSDIRRSVFAGSVLIGCSFVNSELVECNFNGCECRDTVFDDSDLRGTRFIGATLHHVGLRNCNLREVHFGKSVRVECDMRYSNPQDSYDRLPGRRV